MKMDLKGYLLTGIATVVPLAATAYILLYLIQWVDGISQPIVHALLGRTIPGLGLLITLAVLLLAGVFVSYTMGRKAAELVDCAMRRIPLSRSIYSIIKNISDTFLSENREFGKVVLVKFMPDVFVVGFVGGRSPPEADAATSSKLFNVFVPTSPNPATGVVFMVSDSRILPVNMSVDKGMEIVLSAGFMGTNNGPTELKDET
jgi:uncharacterized membrane protein